MGVYRAGIDPKSVGLTAPIPANVPAKYPDVNGPLRTPPDRPVACILEIIDKK